MLSVAPLSSVESNTVAAGSPVIEIVNFDALEIIVKIDEYDVNAVAVGDEALVTVDALGESFEGQITRISKIAQQSGERQPPDGALVDAQINIALICHIPTGIGAKEIYPLCPVFFRQRSHNCLDLRDRVPCHTYTSCSCELLLVSI